MAKFRFGRWGDHADLWLGGISSWAVSSGDGPRFFAARPLYNDYTSLPATTAALQPHPEAVALQPLTSDDIEAALVSTGLTAQAAAETPIIWLVPLAENEAAIFPQGAEDGPESSAAASFITSSGDHIDFMSSQPAFGLVGGLFVDPGTHTLLTAAEAGHEHIGSGSDDELEIGGDNGPMSLAGFGSMFEQVTLVAGADYQLTAADSNVASGHSLTVSAAALGASHHLVFDGSAETDGRFALEGGAGDDSLTGGHGGDMLHGAGGADTLAGGAGADSFVYLSAAESTGADHDTILDFTFGEDVIDLPVTVQGLDAAVTAGALSDASFDADLGAALGGSVLEAGHALFFTPDSGDLAGHVFLVVDGNGEAGYQAGADFVIELPSVPPADFHGTGFLV